MATEETLDTVKHLTHDDLNGALKAQRKDFEKLLAKQQEQFNASFESLRSPQVKSESAPLLTREVSEDSVEMKKQIKILLERDAQREQTEKNLKLEKSLRDTLGKHGINSRSDLALKYLKDQVSYDEEGQLVMKFDEIAYPLADAVAKFVQTDQGKFLSDPRDLRGSGGVNSTGSPRQTTKPTATNAVGSNGVPIFKDLNEARAYARSYIGNELKL